MRKYVFPAAIAAAAARARLQDHRIPLYLPAYDERLPPLPETGNDEDVEVDASGITVGGDADDDDDFY